MACDYSKPGINWAITDKEDFIFGGDSPDASLFELRYVGPEWQSDDVGPMIIVRRSPKGGLEIVFHGMLTKNGEFVYMRIYSDDVAAARAMALSTSRKVPTFKSIGKLTGERVELSPWRSRND